MLWKTNKLVKLISLLFITLLFYNCENEVADDDVFLQPSSSMKKLTKEDGSDSGENGGSGGSGSSVSTTGIWATDYLYNSGWRVDKHPRIVADVNGDGKVDIVAFGDSNVTVS